jgi:hypothetical protein
MELCQHSPSLRKRPNGRFDSLDAAFSKLCAHKLDAISILRVLLGSRFLKNNRRARSSSDRNNEIVGGCQRLLVARHEPLWTPYHRIHVPSLCKKKNHRQLRL